MIGCNLSVKYEAGKHEMRVLVICVITLRMNTNTSHGTSGISDLLDLLTPPESPDAVQMSAHVSMYSPDLHQSLPACLADLVEFREDDFGDRRRQRQRLDSTVNFVLNMTGAEDHQDSDNFDEFADFVDAVGKSSC